MDPEWNLDPTFVSAENLLQLEVYISFVMQKFHCICCFIFHHHIFPIICELCVKKHWLCDIFYASSKWIDVNPQSHDTTVLPWGDSSNSEVRFVYTLIDQLYHAVEYRLVQWNIGRHQLCIGAVFWYCVSYSTLECLPQTQYKTNNFVRNQFDAGTIILGEFPVKYNCRYQILTQFTKI